MSRISFPLYKRNADGTANLDNSVNINVITFQKDGVTYDRDTADIRNNGDGTYSMYVSSSGEYTCLINGSEQDEFKDLYLVSGDDNLITSMVDDTTIQLNASNELEVVNGSTMLFESDIIDNLTSTSTTDALSANQGQTLKTLVDGKETADSTIIKEGDLNSDISTGGTTKAVNAEVLRNHLNQNYSNEIYLDNDKYVWQNIEKLQNAVYNLSTTNGNTNGKTILTFSYSGSVKMSGSVYMNYQEGDITEARLPSAGKITGLGLSYKTNNIGVGGGSIDTTARLKFYVYINGVKQTADYLSLGPVGQTDLHDSFTTEFNFTPGQPIKVLADIGDMVDGDLEKPVVNVEVLLS